MKYNVKFNTGIGNKFDLDTIEEAKDYADKYCSFIQFPIHIEDSDGNIIYSRLGFFEDWK